MYKSAWRCPQCKNTLYVTKSARYWCTICKAEKDPDKVDEMGRDFVMTQVLIEIATERIMP